MGDIADLTADRFETEVLQASTPVLVYFRTDSCGPCAQLAPILEKAATTYAGKLDFMKMNIEDGAEKALSKELDLVGVPTLLVYKNGREAGRWVGWGGGVGGNIITGWIDSTL